MGLFRRPFASVREMDEALVARWNAVVGPDDTVWHLGDVAVDRRIGRIADLVAALNGTKHLVAGNNDGEAIRALPHCASVQDYRELGAERFDRVASIGMVEHVGAVNIDAYAQHVVDALEPGGVLLNHGIARLRHATRRPARSRSASCSPTRRRCTSRGSSPRSRRRA